jgi:hypothetical protein
MEKILALIEEKNMYLEKFCAINSDQINKLKQGSFDELEVFRESRENILNILNHIDALLSSHAALVDEKTITRADRQRLEDALNHKDEMVRVILSQDIDIMGAIESAKSEIIRQLRSVVKGRKAVSAYKSGDRTDIVDEEV